MFWILGLLAVVLAALAACAWLAGGAELLVGNILPISLIALAVLLAGVGVGLKVAWDAEKAAESGRRELEQAFTLLNSIPAGILVVDPETHEIEDANLTALEEFGERSELVVGRSCMDFIRPPEAGLCPITDLGKEEDSSECLLTRADGEARQVFKRAILTEVGGRRRIVEVFIDITERKLREHSLRRAYAHQEELAAKDALTGLFNRRSIIKHAEAELCRAERGGEVSIGLVDLDRFKTINDTHGHQVGDLVLRKAAEVISLGLRPYDWVGRWGGEEFMLVLPGASVEMAAEIGERLRRAVAVTSVQLPDGKTLYFSASFGFTCSSANHGRFVPLERLISQADEALYKAKTEGRNRVCLFHTDTGSGDWRSAYRKR